MLFYYAKNNNVDAIISNIDVIRRSCSVPNLIAVAVRKNRYEIVKLLGENFGSFFEVNFLLEPIFKICIIYSDARMMSLLLSLSGLLDSDLVVSLIIECIKFDKDEHLASLLDMLTFEWMFLLGLVVYAAEYDSLNCWTFLQSKMTQTQWTLSYPNALLRYKPYHICNHANTYVPLNSSLCYYHRKYINKPWVESLKKILPTFCVVLDK
jgi:hypothetical protein